MIEFPKETLKKEDFKAALKKTEPLPFSPKEPFPLFMEFADMKEDILHFWSEVLKEKKEEKEVDADATLSSAPATLFAPFQQQSVTEVKSSTVSSISSLEATALLEKMADCIIHMDNSGITETKIFLNAPEFSSSPFYGSEIIIQEYSTAPKVFNIQFSSSSTGLALFQSHIAPMMAAFHKANFAFSINRLDTYLKEEEPLVVRKENVSEDKKQDEKGQR